MQAILLNLFYFTTYNQKDGFLLAIVSTEDTFSVPVNSIFDFHLGIPKVEFF